MHQKKGLLIICFLFSIKLFAQYNDFKFIYPIDREPIITGNYGELRPNHFHAGLDFSTDPIKNLPIKSVADGYVSRIKISSVGYGKVLYITHSNGYVSVYAHQKKYADKIETFIKQRQYNLKKNERPLRDSLGGDKLMRNDNNHFVDVSEKAGIYGSVIGFGLGVTVGDINKDGWQDIFVSNDFFERDYLYMNNTDGTFREVLTEQMNSISGASMGADLADINNDGLADIFVTEMLPQDNARLKTVTTFEDWNRYQYNLQNGYYHQFTRNMLQLNQGNETFSEIGML